MPKNSEFVLFTTMAPTCEEEEHFYTGSLAIVKGYQRMPCRGAPAPPLQPPGRCRGGSKINAAKPPL
jgi:hypothetical protein